jgi:hypothetical protein
MSIEKKRQAVAEGSVVAFRKGKEAVWYVVTSTIGKFGIVYREEGTSNAEQVIDRCYIEQVRAA